MEGYWAILNVAKLTDIQRIRVGLPEWEGGIAMTTAYEVMDSGFVASAGAVARWWSGGAWPEAKVLAHAGTGPSPFFVPRCEFGRKSNFCAACSALPSAQSRGAVYKFPIDRRHSEL